MAQQHVMLDLETFGTSHDALIVAIGAVKFTPEHHLLGERFYAVIDPVTSAQFGGKVDIKTVLWWMSHERTKAREAMLAEDMVDISSALEGFALWYGTDEFLPIWGNGAAFDNVILRNAYQRSGMDAPWSYRADRDYRTICNFKHDLAYERTGVYHTAVDDAVSQALHLMKIGNKLRLQFR